MEGTIDLETGDKATQSVSNSKPIERAIIFFVTKSSDTRRLPMANIEKKNGWMYQPKQLLEDVKHQYFNFPYLLTYGILNDGSENSVVHRDSKSLTILFAWLRSNVRRS